MQRARRSLLIAAPIALLLATGCATPTRGPADLAGRLSVRMAEGSDQARSFSADFDLRGDATRGDLRLTGPLGATVALARWQPGEAALTGNDGSVRRFDTLDQLALALLGETLPLAALIDWLRGRPWPGAMSQATVAGFDQLGWVIDLARFSEGLLSAARTAQGALASVQVRVRLDRAG